MTDFEKNLQAAKDGLLSGLAMYVSQMDRIIGGGKK